MRKQLFTALLIGIFLCSSCGEPSKEELVEIYERAKDDFESLKSAIIEDTKDRDCFVVGLDDIGDYWKPGDVWVHKYGSETKLSLSKVLELERLDKDRFNLYKQLFEKTGSEKVSYCRDGKFGPWVNVLIHRSGISVSGCVGTIDWSQIMREPYGQRNEGHFQEVSTLSDGWYLVYSCT